MEPVVSEYEVFRNDRNALAFFFARRSFLDRNPAEGPFWFTIEDSRISAGTAECHAVFEDIQPGLAEAARARGVIMMVEFENRQPVRCTPCYYTDRF